MVGAYTGNIMARNALARSLLKGAAIALIAQVRTTICCMVPLLVVAEARAAVLFRTPIARGVRETYCMRARPGVQL